MDMLILWPWSEIGFNSQFEVAPVQPTGLGEGLSSLCGEGIKRTISSLFLTSQAGLLGVVSSKKVVVMAISSCWAYLDSQEDVLMPRLQFVLPISSQERGLQ